MIIASIAMEELALSHILNAEGEKLQYILGKCPCACSQDVLAVNKSVTALVEAVTQNQILLKNKLAQVLEFCPPPPSPPPVCRPEPGPAPCRPGPCVCPCLPQCPASCQMLSCEKSAVQLVGQREKMLWNPGCRLSWRLRSRAGNSICWDGHNPAQLQLGPGKTYVIQYTLNLCAVLPTEGKILLKQSPRGAFTETPPLHFSVRNPQQTLHYVAVLHPCKGGECGTALSLTLEAGAPVCVERAVLDAAEL